MSHLQSATAMLPHLLCSVPSVRHYAKTLVTVV